MKLRRLAILSMAVAAMVFGPSAGDLLALGSAPYPKDQVSFEVYDHDRSVVRPGESAVYQFSWNGVDAAEATFEIAADPNRPGYICAELLGKTIGAPSLIYQANDSINECMTADGLKPDKYSIRIRESLDYYDMEVEFDHGAGEADKEKQTRDQREEKTYEFTNGFGPVSAAMLIRSLDWEVGDERRFEIIDGNGRYLLVFKAVEEGQITVPAGTFAAIRVEPSVFRMPSDRAREQPYYWERLRKKDAEALTMIKSFEFWMAKDPPRHFLKARSDLYFGHVDMELKEFN